MSGPIMPGLTRTRLRSKSINIGSSRPEEKHMAHVHGQDHDDHSHEGVIAVQEGPLTHYQVMETALREQLIEKGVFTADDVRREVELMEGRSPGQGARMIARAWVD